MPRKPTAPEQPAPRLLDTLSVATGPAKPDPKKNDRVETAGLHQYVALSRVNNEVGGDKGHMKAHPVKALILGRVMEIGNAQGHGRDLNYTGFEGDTTASCQYRILNSDQKLTDDKVDRLTAMGIRTTKRTLQPRALVVQYDDDDEVLEQIMQTLHKAGFDIQALFQRQHEVSYPIVDPVHTLNDIFDHKKNLTDDQRREALEMVGYPMISPQKFDGELPDAWEITRRIVVPTEKEQAEDMAKAAAAAKKAKPARPAPTNNGAAAVAAAPAARQPTDLTATLKASLVMENVVAGVVTGEVKTRSQSRARGKAARA